MPCSHRHRIGLGIAVAIGLVAGDVDAKPVKKRWSVPPPLTGTVEVPLDHTSRNKKRTRQLHFVRYLRKGAARQPVIMLHGGPGAPIPVGRILQSPFGDVLLRHYDVVYFDQRGAGRSLLPREKQRRHVVRNKRLYQVGQYVEDLELLRLKIFGKRKVTILGASWGGFLGVAYAIKYPASVRALVLGSFAGTGRYAGKLCETVDRTLAAAEAKRPALRRALHRFRAAVAASKIVWRRGTAKERPLRAADIIEVALPFAVKARYEELARVLDMLVKGQTKGQPFLDKLDLDNGETASAGGSLPGEATLCQAFLDRAMLRGQLRHPASTTYCDDRAVVGGLLKLCGPYFSPRQIFDVHKELRGITVPALIFAGRWDPLLEWRYTLQVAREMPRATFVLIDGGHTPIKAGGGCFAKTVGAFATGGKMDLSCFMAHWP